MTDRGVSSVVAVALLVAVAVALAGTVALAVDTAADVDRSRTATFDLAADATGRVTLVHDGGDRLDVRRLRIRIAVDGTALADQPPIPFFSAGGFRSGPTGPFNVASDPYWTAGERASLRVAGTNDPAIAAGDRVRVRILVGDYLVWEGTTVAGSARLRTRKTNYRGRNPLLGGSKLYGRNSLLGGSKLYGRNSLLGGSKIAGETRS